MVVQDAATVRARGGCCAVRIQNQLQAAIQKVESSTRALGATENEVRVAVEQMRLSSEQAATDELRRWQEQMDQRSADAQARLASLTGCADGAGRSVAEVDAGLGAEEDALRRWLMASEAARRKLAEWVNRG